MRFFFFQESSLPRGSLRGIFEWINVEKKKEKKKKAEIHFEISVFQEYFLHCNVSFLFLLKRWQINGFLAEISNRKQRKKLPRKLHLSSPPHCWHCVCNIGQHSHWSHCVCTITSLHKDATLWYWPLPGQLEIPRLLTCTTSALQPCPLRQDDFVRQINHHCRC